MRDYYTSELEKGMNVWLFEISDDLNQCVEKLISSSGTLVLPALPELQDSEQLVSTQISTEGLLEKLKPLEFLEHLDLTEWNVDNAVNLTNLLNMNEQIICKSIDVSTWCTRNARTFSNLFADFRYLKQIDLSNFDTHKVTHMDSLFAYCEDLTDVNLSSFNTSKVRDMSTMFKYCSWFETLDLSHFDLQSIESMYAMFEAGSANHLVMPAMHLDKQIVTDIFYCSSFFILDLSRWTFELEDLNDLNALVKFFDKKSMFTDTDIKKLYLHSMYKQYQQSVMDYFGDGTEVYFSEYK